MNEEAFKYSTGTILWVVAVGILATLVSAKVSESLEWLFGLGFGLVFVAGWMGSFRTGHYFSWDPPIQPNRFEGLLGWSGAAVIVGALAGLFLQM